MFFAEASGMMHLAVGVSVKVVTGNQASDRVFVYICLSPPKTTCSMAAALKNWEWVTIRNTR
jgi:hypothetical protein